MIYRLLSLHWNSRNVGGYIPLNHQCSFANLGSNVPARPFSRGSGKIPEKRKTSGKIWPIFELMAPIARPGNSPVSSDLNSQTFSETSDNNTESFVPLASSNAAAEPRSVDGVQPLEVATDLICPRCATELSGGKLDEFPVAFCTSCYGVLIDHDGVSNVICIRRSEYQGADRTPHPADQAALETESRCPNCGELMEVYFYGGPGNVVMDGCRSCGMVWMDNGEITTIVRAPGLRRF